MKKTRHPRYARHRFPAEVISHAVWLYFRFLLSLRMVEEMLATRGILISHETVRQWALKFGQGFANQIRRRLPAAGDKWHLDEVVISIAGKKHWLWRAVTNMRSCSTSWFRAAAMQREPSGYCASCSRSSAWLLG
jgi:putative transposase